MKHLHKFVLVAVVAALLAFALGACKNSGNTLARWGGAAGGAVVGGAIGGPVGAGVGAVAGDAGGDVLVPYEEGPTTTINNGKGGVVYTSTAHPGVLASLAWYVWLALGVALLLAFPRTRGHLLGFVYSAALGHVWSATMKLLALLGLVKSETANATLASARRRRGKAPPAVIISQETKHHDL